MKTKKQEEPRYENKLTLREGNLITDFFNLIVEQDYYLSDDFLDGLNRLLEDLKLKHKGNKKW